MAGHQTMSGQDEYLSSQNLGLVVILTGHAVSKQLTRKHRHTKCARVIFYVIGAFVELFTVII